MAENKNQKPVLPKPEKSSAKKSDTKHLSESVTRKYANEDSSGGGVETKPKK